jgi:hypothetical protein
LQSSPDFGKSGEESDGMEFTIIREQSSPEPELPKQRTLPPPMPEEEEEDIEEEEDQADDDVSRVNTVIPSLSYNILLFILWVGRIEGKKKLVSAMEWACAS